jgi:predicted transcriptional regulator
VAAVTQQGWCLLTTWRSKADLKMQTLADASHARYTEAMKTATIPPVRIDPSFRKDIEQCLEINESLASLVEKAVRNEVTRRRVQSEFLRRGMAAISRTVAAGDGIPAETVIAKLEAKLAAARQAKSA